MSGVTHCVGNAFVTDRGAGWLRALSCRTQNAEGSWRSTSRGYMAPRGGGVHHQERLVGEGGSEGLFALQRCDQDARTGVFECEGAIFERGLPGTPAEAPPAILNA